MEFQKYQIWFSSQIRKNYFKEEEDKASESVQHFAGQKPCSRKQSLCLLMKSAHSVGSRSKRHSSLSFFVSLQTQQGPSFFLGVCCPGAKLASAGFWGVLIFKNNQLRSGLYSYSINKTTGFIQVFDICPYFQDIILAFFPQKLLSQMSQSKPTNSNSYKNVRQFDTNMNSTESFDEKKDKCPPKGNILHIANIHPQLNYEQIKQALYNLFSVHGPIYDITIKTKENGTHFAFVDFPDIRDAEKALQASKNQGKILQNQQLIVNYCEDPKKNEARKGAKCFLCHGTGHKAKNCTVRPELIKPSKKAQISQSFQEDKKYLDSFSFSREQLGLSSDIKAKQLNFDESEDESKEYESSSDSQSNQDSKGRHRRDRDYLRFLKLKKKLLQKKLKKKILKAKSRRH